MQIVEKKLNEIKPYEKNPRKNDDAVKYVAESIKQFGFKVPIVIDKDGVIVCGHTRYKAAKQLKLPTVPTIAADDLTDEQIKAFRLADNKTSEFAEWDDAMLSDELSDILDIDMSDFGFGLLEDEDETKRKEATDDNYSVNLPKEAKAKLGDVYQLGEHRLMCGDSTKAEDIERLMQDKHARMIFTSPPYSNLRTYEGGKNLDVDNIAQFIGAYKDYCDFECVNLGLKFVDNEIDQYWNRYFDIAHENGMKLLAWNVWDKKMAGSIGMQRHMFPVRHEWIFVFGENPEKINKTWEKKTKEIRNGLVARRQPDGSLKYSSVGDTSSKFKCMESVVAVNSYIGSLRKDHPAIFPVELPSEYIQALTDEEDCVIEPFGGSGTTLIACEQLNRKCFCMELEPKYIDVIIDRWEEYTGKKAIKIDKVGEA